MTGGRCGRRIVGRCEGGSREDGRGRHNESPVTVRCRPRRVVPSDPMTWSSVASDCVLQRPMLFDDSRREYSGLVVYLVYSQLLNGRL